MLMAANDINPTTPVGDVFEASDITVNLKRVGQTSARLGVEEPRAFKVLRSELLGSEEAA